jgi:hypothetical protein
MGTMVRTAQMVSTGTMGFKDHPGMMDRTVPMAFKVPQGTTGFKDQTGMTDLKDPWGMMEPPVLRSHLRGSGTLIPPGTTQVMLFVMTVRICTLPCSTSPNRVSASITRVIGNRSYQVGLQAAKALPGMMVSTDLKVPRGMTVRTAQTVWMVPTATTDLKVPQETMVPTASKDRQGVMVLQVQMEVKVLLAQTDKMDRTV